MDKEASLAEDLVMHMTFFSSLIIPALLTLFGLACVFSKRDVPSAFLEGAADGVRSGIGLLPSLVILMTAVSMFSASGAAEALSELLEPIMTKLGIPSELIPLIVVRPVSGSGSTAMLSEIFEKYGPDSYAAKCASVLMASSDTLVYVAGVYMSAAGVRKTRHTLPAAFLVMLLGIFLSCYSKEESFSSPVHSVI